MTLGAAFKYRNTGWMFMIGDGLIVSKSNPGGGFLMPGADVIGRPESEHGYLASFEQKLNILGPDLAFSYSGNQHVAYQFAAQIEKLYESHCKPHLLVQSLDKWVEELPEKDKNDIQLIVIGLLNGGCFGWNHRASEFSPYNRIEKLWVTGTGRETFLDIISEEHRANPSSEMEALGDAMNIVSRFYHDDLFEKKNYLQAFGGFYELAVCDGIKIQKVSDILVAMVKIDAQQLDRGFAFQMVFFKYDFVKDLTVLREIRVKGDTKSHDIIKRYHLTLPISPKRRKDARVAAEEIAAESQNYMFGLPGDIRAKHCLVMLYLRDGNRKQLVPYYFCRPKRNSPIVIFHDDGDLVTDMEQGLVDTIHSTIDKYFDREEGRLRTPEELVD